MDNLMMVSLEDWLELAASKGYTLEEVADMMQEALYEVGYLDELEEEDADLS